MRTSSSRVRALLSLASIAVVAPALAAPAAPASYPDQREGDFTVKDFKLQDGEVLAEARFHYTTVGTPRRDGAGRVTNAVLMLHGTTGTGKNFLAPNLA